MRIRVALSVGDTLEMSLMDAPHPSSVLIDITESARLEVSEVEPQTFAPTTSGDHVLEVAGTGPFTLALEIPQ